MTSLEKSNLNLICHAQGHDWDDGEQGLYSRGFTCKRCGVFEIDD